MSTIQNLRRSSIRDWRPVCSAVGAAVLGAEPAPFPSLLPPASGWSGRVRSLRALLWTFSVPLFCERQTVCSGWLIFSLSLLLSHSLSCYLTLAPSDCPQGTQARSLPSAMPPAPLRPPPLAGGRCGRLGYFNAGNCF